MPNRLLPRSREHALWALVVACILIFVGCDARIGEPGSGADANTPGLIDAADGVVDSSLAIDATLPPLPIDATPPPPPPPVDATPPPPTCDQIYGAATEYLLCQQGLDTCEFNAFTNGGNCNQMCAAFGGTCVAAYDNQAGAECVRVVGSTDDCTTNRNTEICVCSR